MAAENNIKSFTAADIEKYHKGLLSPQEKHALEKAALDDPFLADALEGYATPGVNMAADLAELKKRLAERTADTKVIPFSKDRRMFSPFLRAAAMIIILAGAGLLVYQFAFNKKDRSAEVAQNKTENQPPLTGTTATGKADSGNVSTGAEIKNTTPPADIVNNTAAVNPDNTAGKSHPLNKDEEALKPSSPVADREEEKITEPAGSLAEVKTAPAGGAPVAATSTAKEGEIKSQKEDADKTVTRELAKVKAPAPKKQEAAETTRGLDFDEESKGRRDVASNAQGVTDEKAYNRKQAMNTFRGRVTDETNTGLPFANVTNTRDNVGTYTDANGNFTLTSTDSVLSVQVRSVGYDDNNTQLRKNIASNKVVMQEDQRLSQFVLDNRKPNAALRRSLTDSSKKLTEPAPVDGWVKYDSYLANNLNIPESFSDVKNEGNNSVQVSFEVDKNGEPVNIRVEKSLCAACDKEAIRLIKEGPKWKRNAKKNGRTTVTINF